MSVNNNCFLDVYIWNTVYHKAESGHVSVAIRKVDPHGQVEKHRHFGFWPNREFSASDVPYHLPAVEKISLDEEIWYTEDDPLFIPNKHYLVTINQDQYTEIENEIKNQSDNIKSGKTRYTWLTSINNLFYNSLNWNANFQKADTTNLENCSTIAVKILSAGNIPIKNNSFLWGISPNGVSYQLDQLLNQNIIAGKCSNF